MLTDLKGIAGPGLRLFGMEHNHHHVYVQKVILWTYHKLLVSILQKPLVSVFKRLQHVLLWLQQYDCEIRYKPGKETLLADTLSRAYLEDYERSASKSEVECINATHFLPVPDHQLKELQRETACDPTLQFVKKAILDGVPDTKDEQPAAIHQYCISLNNISFFAQKGGNYSREGDYLREPIISILLTGSRVLNILFYFSIKSKNNHAK